jgi:hypothetical protein
MLPDPLQFLDGFKPHDGPKLDAPWLTLIAIDDRSDSDTTKRLASITRWHRRFIRPKREVIVSGSRPDVDGVEWIKLDKWKGHYAQCYSLWCQRELKNHFDTPFVLIWQTDGFCLDPSMFSSEFCDYDYIGAPFFWTNCVGNGGFSMRSKKFCEEVDRLPDTFNSEDVYFTVNKRRELGAAGVKIAPVCVGRKFSVEIAPNTEPRSNVLAGRFGFHSKGLMSETLNLIFKRWFDFDGMNITLNSGIQWKSGRLVKPFSEVPAYHIAPVVR